jgi:hypothetical protein
MRKRLVPALILAASAMAGAAIAATTPPPADDDRPGMAGGPGEDGGPGGHHRHFFMRQHWNPAAHLDGRLAYIKAELKIKPAQEGAWTDFAAAFRKSATILDESRPGKPGERQGPMPIPARLDRAEQRLTAHLDALKTVKGPASKLYDSLDDSQKKAADELVLGPMAMR